MNKLFMSVNNSCKDNSVNNKIDSTCKHPNNCICYSCLPCIPFVNGATGATGPQGEPVEALDYADFYALMPPDNSATVATGTDVNFPQDGPNSGSAISRLSASSFNLEEIGTYQILFQVGVSEAGQLILTINGADLEYTVVGRATGTSQIIGMAIVTTSSINSVLPVCNPAGNAAALTITPLAGGTRPVSAHLVILKIQ